MINVFAQNNILYYPTIEFQDIAWLKSTLCFWDKIYRIRPVSYYPQDNEDVEAAIKNGVIIDIELNVTDLSQTAKQFEKVVENLEFMPSGFSSTTYDVGLHQDKVDERLKSFFKSFRGDVDRNGFYHVPTDVANGYMFFLADTISKRRNIPKLTDDKDMFAAMSYIDVQGKFGENLFDADAREVYTNLVIDCLIPADIQNVSIETILKRNDKLAASKIEFRKLLCSLMDDLSKIEDRDFAIRRIDKFKSDIAEQRSTYRDQLRTMVTEFLPSVMYIGFPAFAASLINAFSKNTKTLYLSKF